MSTAVLSDVRFWMEYFRVRLDMNKLPESNLSRLGEALDAKFLNEMSVPAMDTTCCTAEVPVVAAEVPVEIPAEVPVVAPEVPVVAPEVAAEVPEVVAEAPVEAPAEVPVVVAEVVTEVPAQ
uniref:Uncharacterized protein n=1 Tax=viral metagenome TaxID=1070528 RepID=A0A6C0CN27_9ZZZZ